MKKIDHCYGFFTSFGNDPMHNQFVHLSSSTSYGDDSHHLMGRGAYIYSSNIRSCFVLFSVRSMIKSNWINSNDSYVVEIEKQKTKSFLQKERNSNK